MLRIYAIPVSLYSAKLRILLRHKGLDWEELPPPGGYGSDIYKQTVPSGNLPALIDGDLVIADSEAIAEYLEDRHPAPPMLPPDPAGRALVRQLSRFHDTRLEPAVRTLFAYLPGQDTPPDGLLARQGLDISARLAQLGRLPAPPSDGTPLLTLGDCGFPITFAWIDALTRRMDLPITWPAPVIAYRDRLSGHAAVTAELADYTPKLMAFLDG